MALSVFFDADVDAEATAETVEARMQSAIGGRLRSLYLASVRGRFRVIAMCPSCHVRQLAEQPGQALRPPDQLEPCVHIVPPERLSPSL